MSRKLEYMQQIGQEWSREPTKLHFTGVSHIDLSELDSIGSALVVRLHHVDVRY